ncbi:hypothetical protein GCM10018782_56400 [Streptomyces griseoaurantiacus]|nr:hypothetical protein GCM10018782_56400 [Streptomyces griseoaurantiacus]
MSPGYADTVDEQAGGSPSARAPAVTAGAAVAAAQDATATARIPDSRELPEGAAVTGPHPLARRPALCRR